jgi:tetratricopeptide (TPR) repeat protein
MNRILTIGILTLIAFAFAGCSNPSAISNNTNSGNTNTPRANSNGPVAAHDVPSSPGGNTRPAGGPTGDPIDSTKLDANIEKAELAHNAKPSDAKATKALADAYFARAEELTEARQYRAALGDYRKTLKLDPKNAAAQKMHDQIVSIFQQMGREVPAEGQEPPPLRK